jgi:hypothetical protein
MLAEVREIVGGVAIMPLFLMGLLVLVGDYIFPQSVLAFAAYFFMKYLVVFAIGGGVVFASYLRLRIIETILEFLIWCPKGVVG